MKKGVTKQEFIDKTVVIHFENRDEERVNIACDSAMAIINDVSNHIL